MSTTFGGSRFVKPAEDTAVNLPAKASVALSPGDLLFWDAAGKVVVPFDQFVATGTAATDLTTIGGSFAGVAQNGKLAADASTGYPSASGEAIRCLQDVIYEADCDSGTFEVGDLVSAAVAAGTGAGKVSANKVAKTTTAGQVIGFVAQRYASATTRVQVRLIGKFSPARFAKSI